MIGEIALAIEMGADGVDIGKTIHPHPTLGESIGMAAEVYEGRLHRLAAGAQALMEPFPAQVEAVTPDTKLVSILIGGNDIAYVGDLFGFSCRTEGKSACQVTSPTQLDERLDALPGKLDRVIDAVRTRAPAARIVMVGYLPAVPDDAAVCGALPLAPADAQRMHETTVRLTQVFDSTAARKHVDIVHAASIGKGHDACTAAPYITGYRPARMPGWKDPVGYHPTQAGMDALAAGFDKLLAR
jgi:lysophospholipase L1-like esterase